MTPETWKNDLEKFHQSQHSTDCNVTNVHRIRMAFHSTRLALRRAAITQQCTFEAQFEGNDHMHGTAKMQMTGQAFPQGMTMNMTMNSHYVGADCGDVKPGSAKVIH